MKPLHEVLLFLIYAINAIALAASKLEALRRMNVEGMTPEWKRGFAVSAAITVLLWPIATPLAIFVLVYRSRRDDDIPF